MKWGIAIFVAVLASAVPALSQTAVQVVKHATGTLDYENVSEHDCRPGIGVPVRFVAENVELEMTFVGQTYTIRTSRGGQVTKYVGLNRDFEKPSDFLESGFLLDVDVTFCVSPFTTAITSGRWKVWHEDGDVHWEVSGELSFGGSLRNELRFWAGGIGGIVIDNGGTGSNARYSQNYRIEVVAERLNFPRLRETDGGLSHAINAKAIISVKPVDTSGEESND